MSVTKKMTRRSMAALDAGLALFTGGAAAFFTFAMPQYLFEALAVRSGLPRVLAAAQPPLGADARWAAVGVAGLVCAALVWTVMKALDRRPAAPADAAQAPERPAEPAVRIRKADAHPDAPARAPILASEELGEPLDLAVEDAVPAEEPEPARPLPAFLVTDEPETAAQHEPEADDFFGPEGEEEPEPEGTEAESIGNLMQRFESGLARKKQAIERAPFPAPAAAPAPPPVAVAPEAPAAPVLADDQVGHRLRSAIAGLQRASGTGG
jgi:hypothetical protein